MNKVIHIFVSALFAAVAAMAQDPSLTQGRQIVPVTVHPGNGYLDVSLPNLSSQFWKDGSGRADAEINELANNGVGYPMRSFQTNYEVRGLLLKARIFYHRPGPEAMTVTVRLMGVLDKNGGVNTEFLGKCSLAASSAASSANQGAADHNGRGGDSIIANSLAGSQPPNSGDGKKLGEYGQPGSSAGVSGGEPGASSSSIPSWLWMIPIGAVIILVAIVVKRRIPLGRHSSGSPIKSIPVSVVTRANETPQAPSADQSHLADINQELATIRTKLQGWEKSPPWSMPPQQIELLGTTADLERLIQVGQFRTNVPETATLKPAGGMSVVCGVDDVEYKTASVVNGWLAEKDSKRPDLIDKAKAMGLKAQLASLKDVDQPQSQFEYRFEINQHGAWLWSPVANSSEICVAPADAAMLGMGMAPSILACLFDGMDNPIQNFRFEAVYQPCRLRRAGNKSDCYELVRKGLLQLVGNPPPGGSSPPVYKPSIKQPLSPSTTAKWTSSSATVAKVLADWMNTIAKRIADQAEILNGLGTTTPRLPSPAVRDTTSSESGAVLNLQRQITDMQSSIKQFETFPNTLKDLRDAIDAMQLKIDSARNDRESITVHEPEEATMISIPAEGRIECPEVLPISTPNANQEEAPVEATSQEGMMPAGWEQAWREAANQLSSQPERTEFPDPALYLQRLLDLQKSLRDCGLGGKVSVVHLKVVRAVRDNTGDGFEIHEVAPMSGDAASLGCSRCSDIHLQWQFAVCAALQSGEQMNIVFPKGAYSKSAYSSGYPMLIDNPDNSFRITEPDFAELQPLDRPASIYRVVRHMSCAKPAVAGMGRC